jgi:hypothetical protein
MVSDTPNGIYEVGYSVVGGQFVRVLNLPTFCDIAIVGRKRSCDRCWAAV